MWTEWTLDWGITPKKIVAKRFVRVPTGAAPFVPKERGDNSRRVLENGVLAGEDER